MWKKANTAGPEMNKGECDVGLYFENSGHQEKTKKKNFLSVFEEAEKMTMKSKNY